MSESHNHSTHEPAERRRMEELHEQQRALVRLSLLTSKRSDHPTSRR